MAIEEKDYILEMEERLFGCTPRTEEQLNISEKDFVPLKTGIEDYKLLRWAPKHILDAD